MNNSSPHNSLGSKPGRKKPLGQLLSEAGLISAQQIELALQEQIINNSGKKIGEIFADRGWIKQETADFFVEQWNQLVEQSQKKPLVYYLRAAGLLNEREIEDILKQRNNSNKKVRFHHIAVEKGLIERETIDFFVRNLLAPSNNKAADGVSFATPYELLKNYIRGETNFQRAQLNKIKLNHVTLKGVNLNNSNLTGAELKQANLSNSSLKQADLSSANLEKAILKDVDFGSACMIHVNLTDAHLEGSNFQQANLVDADLRDAYFVNACFFGTDLRNIKFDGANFEGASYNSTTAFNPEFNPEAMGMKLFV